MNENFFIPLTRRMLLIMTALFLWVAMGGGVIQYFSGRTGIGLVFMLVGLIVLVAIARRRLLERYIGRDIAKVNIYILFPLLFLFAGSEIYSFITQPAGNEIAHLAQGIFSLGFLLLVLLLAWEFVVTIRSERPPRG